MTAAPLKGGDCMGADDLSNVAVAAMSLLGTLAGSGGSIYAAHRLLSYRLERLEATVREREDAIQRIYRLERETAVIREQIREISGKK